MKPESQAYLHGALDIIQREALFSPQLDWPEVIRTCEVLAASAVSSADTCPALRYALGALKDRHSFLRLLQASTVQAGVFGMYFTAGVLGTVLPGSPAEAAGLRPGDRLLALDGQPPGPGVNDGLPVGLQVSLEVQRGPRQCTVHLTRTDIPAHQPRPTGRLLGAGRGGSGDPARL